MASVTRSKSRVLPAAYPVVALMLAFALLPSILRPPPEQTTDSAALNPDAPPDDQSEQVIQALQQAKGGGAGGAEGVLTTTTTIPVKRPPASGRCFGSPARQTESVYSPACAAAFSGDNGGSTSRNVFANEIRLGFWHSLGTPPEGKVADEAAPGENAETRTFRVLENWFNKRYQTWGRKIEFYAMRGAGDPADDAAAATEFGEQHKVFAAYHLDKSFCEPFARKYGPVFCNPMRKEVYEQNRPNFFSFMIDRTTAAGFASEYACKKLVGKKAKFAGTADLQARERKMAVVAENNPAGGMPPQVFDDALKKECGASYTGGLYELRPGGEAADAGAAVVQMQSSGVTTVVLEANVINTYYLMGAADAQGWQPEWVIYNTLGLDFNTIGTILPPNQSSHLFGLSSWEVPRRFEETECYQAYKEIDPDNEPSSTSCGLHWHIMLMMLNGIQEAGPKLTPESFEKGLFKIGYRYPPEPWAIGGGYGPNDYSYMDNVAEIWFSHNAINPENSAPGAYVWTYGAKRFKRGELPADDSQLFAHGVTTPGGPDNTS